MLKKTLTPKPEDGIFDQILLIDWILQTQLLRGEQGRWTAVKSLMELRLSF